MVKRTAPNAMPDLTDRLPPEQVAALVDAVRDYAIYGLDPGGRIRSWNPGAERIKGWAADEIIGRHFSVFYPPEDVRAGKPERALDTAVRTGKYEEEGWRHRKDGSRFMAHVIITPVYSKGGRLEGFVKVTRDVTDRAMSEQSLRSNLEELDQANKALAERNREQEHFIHAVSHDLRSPLLAVSGMTELLAEAVAAGERDEAELLLSRVQVNVDRTQRLLNDLLHYLRVGRGNAASEDIDLGEKVRSVLADLAPSVRARKVQLTLPDDWPMVHFPRSEVYEVLANLVGNAVKFSGRDGLAPAVELSWEREGDSIILTVSDNGRGIPPEHREDVFGLFSRLDPSKEGTGLGLSIVRRILDSRGGRVSINTSPSDGASFVLTLPAASRDAR
jgi:PAS domain S-box-containing protein